MFFVRVVDGPVGGPFSFDLDLGLIEPPAARNPRFLPVPAQPPLHLGCLALSPSIDRCVVDINAALIKHFLD